MRWGSTYEMVSHIVELQQALSAVLSEDRKIWHKMPSNVEFSVLETIVDILRPLLYLTDALLGEKEVTASAVISLLKHACQSKLWIFKIGKRDANHIMELELSRAHTLCTPSICSLLHSGTEIDL